MACNECSETLRVIDADSNEAYKMLNPPKQLGLFLGSMPLTADGCCFGEGATIYGPSPNKDDDSIITYVMSIGHGKVSDGDRLNQDLNKCYSSYAAAERAYPRKLQKK